MRIIERAQATMGAQLLEIIKRDTAIATLEAEIAALKAAQEATK